MVTRRGHDLLGVPVRLGDIELGRPVDLIVDLDAGRVLGLDVRCGDEAHRFLPLAVAALADGEITITSPLLLLDFGQLAFYREEAATLGGLAGTVLPTNGGVSLRDVVFDDEGTISAVEVEDDGDVRRLPYDGVRLPTRHGP